MPSRGSRTQSVSGAGSSDCFSSFRGLLAEDAVFGKAAGDLGGEVGLGGFVGGGNGVTLLVVFELHLDTTTEVACQDLASTAGQLDGE